MNELWGTMQMLLSQLKLRLRASVRRRLALDVMALSTGMRAAVMLDYIGYSTQMLQKLCQLLFHLSEDVDEAKMLRVLDMEGCGYLVHPSYLLEFMDQSLTSPAPLIFVVLDGDSPQKASQAEHEIVLRNLSEVRQRLSSLLAEQKSHTCSAASSTELGKDNPVVTSEASAVQDVLVAKDITGSSGILLPTLNGWLLGYPVVYLFNGGNASRAGRCLVSGSLHLYQVLICSTLLPLAASQNSAGLTNDEDELLSFTMPTALSPLGLSEDWAQVYFEGMKKCVQTASNVWMSVRIEVTARKMESIALNDPEGKEVLPTDMSGVASLATSVRNSQPSRITVPCGYTS